MNFPLPSVRSAPLAGLVFALAIGSAWAVPASAHPHVHGLAGLTELTLDRGSKWVIDPPLDKAMKNIRDALQAEADAIHAGRVAKRTYRVLAKRVNGEVAYMVKNCRLSPEADAQLHRILAEILDGVAAMEGQDELGSRHDGAVRILAALEYYAAYFDAPGFEPIRR